MTFLVGYSPHKDDLAALDLACLLARSDGGSVHALTVVPQGWPTVVAKDSDREFERWAAEEGTASAAEAAEHLGQDHPDVPAETSWVTSRSVPAALLEQASALSADLIVVGSGEDVAHSQVGITSKADRLLHSSPVPVAIAPRGYHVGGDIRVPRITLAFRGDDATWTLLDRVAQIALRVGASMRVVTLAVRGRTMHPARVSGAEDMVLGAWVEQAEAELAEAAAHLRSLGFTEDTASAQVSTGRSWGAALDDLEWLRGEVLVVGSSSTHRLAQVFLGSSAAKIVRHSPVPVIVVP